MDVCGCVWVLCGCVYLCVLVLYCADVRVYCFHSHTHSKTHTLTHSFTQPSSPFSLPLFFFSLTILFLLPYSLFSISTHPSAFPPLTAIYHHHHKHHRRRLLTPAGCRQVPRAGGCVRPQVLACSSTLIITLIGRCGITASLRCLPPRPNLRPIKIMKSHNHGATYPPPILLQQSLYTSPSELLTSLPLPSVINTNSHHYETLYILEDRIIIKIITISTINTISIKYVANQNSYNIWTTISTTATTIY